MVVRFLVVGFGLLMIFLVGSDVVGLWVFFFFGSCGRRWWWDLMFVWLVLGFGVFFFLWVFWPVVVFSGGGGGFRYEVDLQWRMLWFFGFAVEDAKGFLDLGLDAMVWLGFMAGGGCSRSEVREGEWGFGCENQRNHQEGE